MAKETPGNDVGKSGAWGHSNQKSGNKRRKGGRLKGYVAYEYANVDDELNGKTDGTGDRRKM